ncbi:sulfotransferase family 2 domain-containing protein [Niallia sp. NCCP-28]|uniref:sulfotransferase family 2 domain-containing protein n=1 Tax=Niallia sp. NCCP-28 TaxID=2934712 RepID=UPI0020822B9C|nr:sulfotransferase family 2 domain-containing protein [Niallia sp. NCCP-28]GKU80695.1 hypothetical protein NCCP28_00910 [Niallia sp. NCCP-28]
MTSIPENIDDLLKYKTPVYSKDFPIILFWSPKSGCTSILKWFFFQIDLLQKDIQQDPHKYLFTFQNQPDYRKELMEQLSEGKIATYKLVRNPYKRAVSSFLYTVQQDYEPLRKEFESIKNFFNNQTDGISFKQFLFYIKKVGCDLESIDFHIARQYIKNEEIFVKNYIQLENFNAQIREIERHYNLKHSPLSEISNHYHHFAPKMTLTGNFAETIISKKMLEEFIPDYKSFYDKETAELVRDIYNEDFEIYGYDKKEFKL